MGSRLNLILTTVCYMCASAGMSIFNKLAVNHFPVPLTLVSIQMLFTVVVVLCQPSKLTYGGREDITRWSTTVPPLFVGMLATSMVAMQYSTLGTIVVCRNIAPIPTMLVESMFRIPFVISGHTILALLTIIVGVIVYEANDISFSALGVIAIIVNMIFAILERLKQRDLMANRPVELSKRMMMLLNNGLGMLPCLLLAITWGEHRSWSETFGSNSTVDMSGKVYLLISCVNGLFISYLGIRLQHMVAATTFMVITNVNKFAVIFFGIVGLGESRGSMSLIGCTLAITGGFYYAEARKRADALPKPPQELDEAEQPLTGRVRDVDGSDDDDDDDEPEFVD